MSQEVERDIEELTNLLSQATRQTVKNILSNDLDRLQANLKLVRISPFS